MIIKGYTVQQGNTKLYAGVMKVKDLLSDIEVDKFMSGHSDGYQRTLSLARARAFGRFINTAGVSPTSILLNIRDGDYK